MSASTTMSARVAAPAARGMRKGRFSGGAGISAARLGLAQVVDIWPHGRIPVSGVLLRGRVKMIVSSVRAAPGCGASAARRAACRLMFAAPLGLMPSPSKGAPRRHCTAVHRWRRCHCVRRPRNHRHCPVTCRRGRTPRAAGRAARRPEHRRQCGAAFVLTGPDIARATAPVAPSSSSLACPSVVMKTFDGLRRPWTMPRR